MRCAIWVHTTLRLHLYLKPESLVGRLKHQYRNSVGIGAHLSLIHLENTSKLGNVWDKIKRPREAALNFYVCYLAGSSPLNKEDKKCLWDRDEVHPEVCHLHHPYKGEIPQLNFLLLSHLELHLSCFILNIVQVPETRSTMNIAEPLWREIISSV